MECIEEGYVADISVSGIGKIERLSGGMVRIVFYSERYNDAGELEHVVAAKIVRPLSTWPEALRMLSRALGEADLPFVSEGGRIKAMDS